MLNHDSYIKEKYQFYTGQIISILFSPERTSTDTERCEKIKPIFRTGHLALYKIHKKKTFVKSEKPKIELIDTALLSFPHIISTNSFPMIFVFEIPRMVSVVCATTAVHNIHIAATASTDSSATW